MVTNSAYMAHLLAQYVSEEFLLHSVYRTAGEAQSENAERTRNNGISRLKELAALLGYRLEPVTQEIAPTAKSEPSNVVQIGSDYQRTVDTASIVGAPQFDGAAS